MNINRTHYKLFVAIGIGLAFLALGHLFMTIYDVFISETFFVPEDDSVVKLMKQSNLKVDSQANLWKGWISFNITHSLGASFLAFLIIMNAFIWYTWSKISSDTTRTIEEINIPSSIVHGVSKASDAVGIGLTSDDIEKYKKWCFILMITIDVILTCVTIIGIFCWFWLPISAMATMSITMLSTLIYVTFVNHS